MAVAGLMASCAAAPEGDQGGISRGRSTETAAAAAPKRIILFIGDGMGLGVLSGAAYQAGEPLAMFGMDHFGYMATHEHEYVTTDSAASATAIATGEKTHFEAVGVVAGTTEAEEVEDEHQLATVLDAAKAAGRRTGLIATTSIIDATPAAFAAHRFNRRSKEGIAFDISRAGVDLLMGGGSSYFEKYDSGDLLAAMEADGYSVARDAAAVAALDPDAQKVVALLHSKDMPALLRASYPRQMALSEMVTTAIDVLDRDNEEGFFLMVEGSQIDRRGHEVDGEAALAETLDMDAAVAVALAYARGREDTLVVVTADHETGGLIVLDPRTVDEHIEAIGGLEQAALDTRFPSANGFVAPPVASISLPAVVGTSPAPTGDAGDLQAGHGSLVPPELVDRRLMLSYGFLSVASRPRFTENWILYKATHSPTQVPLFVEGPGADRVAASRDNADLGATLMALAGPTVETPTPVDDGHLDPAADDGEGPAAHDPPLPDSARNIILVIADGLGLAPVTAATYATGSRTLVDMPVRGLIATHAEDALVTDAAAASTALSTGRGTRRGALGMVPDGDQLVAATTLLELAEQDGRATGIVSTASLTDPAVAAFYAHRPLAVTDIPASALVAFGDQQTASAGIDVAIGGGRYAFGAPELAELTAQGVEIDLTWHDGLTPLPGQRLLRLVADGHLAAAAERLDGAPGDQPLLAEMTRVAIEALAENDDGFVLIVHAGGLGAVLNRQDRGEDVIDELTDLHLAVAEARRFAAAEPDTLVVVLGTRDSTLSLLDSHYGFHKGQCGAAVRCGGDVPFTPLAIMPEQIHRGEGLTDAAMQGDFAPPTLLLQYAWLTMAANRAAGTADSGAATFTPLFAEGAGSAAFEGFATLADVGLSLAAQISP